VGIDSVRRRFAGSEGNAEWRHDAYEIYEEYAVSCIGLAGYVQRSKVHVEEVKYVERERERKQIEL
jgi:hypothetical protein